MVTLELLQELFPKTSASKLEQFVDPLNATLERFDISTPERVAAFLAQCGHESGGFNFMKENLNYSADGLLKVFPKYFKDRATAEAYARKPQKIASRVYGGRMGNGPEATGEGYKYCGRGLIQITGKANYMNMAEDLGIDPDQIDEYCETVEGACMSAGWFWDVNELNHLADSQDIKSMTKRINGGFNGLDDRIEHYEHAMHLLT